MVYDPEKEVACFDCGDVGGLSFQLTQEIDQSIKECRSKSDIDILDLWEFASKHVQAMIRVDKELQRAPASERHWELLNAKPVELEKFSLEEQCLLEVLQEQIEKAHPPGAEHAPDDVTYTATKEMVEAKIREKTQKQN